MLKGYDVYNGSGNVDHKAAHDKGGASFCIAKISEGSSFVDKYWTSGRPKSIRDAGLKCGGYHFAHPNQNSPVTEAKHCISALDAGGGYKKGDIPVTLDFESSFLGSKRENRMWCESFAREIQKHTGRGCVLYGSTSLLDEHLDELPKGATVLWVASYPNLKIPSVAHTNHGRVLFHQYTDTGHMPGVQGNADLDTFYGTAKELADFCK